MELGPPTPLTPHELDIPFGWKAYPRTLRSRDYEVLFSNPEFYSLRNCDQYVILTVSQASGRSLFVEKGIPDKLLFNSLIVSYVETRLT